MHQARVVADAAGRGMEDLVEDLLEDPGHRTVGQDGLDVQLAVPGPGIEGAMDQAVGQVERPARDHLAEQERVRHRRILGVIDQVQVERDRRRPGDRPLVEILPHGGGERGVLADQVDHHLAQLDAAGPLVAGHRPRPLTMPASQRRRLRRTAARPRRRAPAVVRSSCWPSGRRTATTTPSTSPARMRPAGLVPSPRSTNQRRAPSPQPKSKRWATRRSPRRKTTTSPTSRRAASRRPVISISLPAGISGAMLPVRIGRATRSPGARRRCSSCHWASMASGVSGGRMPGSLSEWRSWPPVRAGVVGQDPRPWGPAQGGSRGVTGLGDHQRGVRDLARAWACGRRGSWPPPAGVDARRFLEDLAPLPYLATLLPVIDAGALPADAAEVHRQLTRQIARRSGSMLLELERLLPRLSAVGGPPVVLKGAALALTAYERPEERWFLDVDLLVERPDVDAVCEHLAAAGFAPVAGVAPPELYD
ncbi:hypothetical protein GF314_00410, partial [bacterium]|nr:hypothetical protein [bacterium]